MQPASVAVLYGMCCFAHLQASAVGGGMYLGGSTVMLADSMAFTNSRAQNGAGWYSGVLLRALCISMNAVRVVTVLPTCVTCWCVLLCQQKFSDVQRAPPLEPSATRCS